jgi:uncharacterized protein YjbI with pentapeptide repeats
LLLTEVRTTTASLLCRPLPAILRYNASGGGDGEANEPGGVGAGETMIQVRQRYTQEVLLCVLADALDRVSFRNANLAQADLRHQSLSPADLTGANLRKALLDWVYLGDANLQKANLEYASLHAASLQGSDLRRANLTGTDLREAFLHETTRLENAILTNTFYDSTTRWPPGFDPQAAGALYLGPRAQLDGMGLNCLDLRRANLRSASLVRADLTDADLVGANLEGADLQDAVLCYVEMTGAYLVGTNLTGANLGGANLTGVIYDRHTRWPQGFDPQGHGAVRQE